MCSAEANRIFDILTIVCRIDNTDEDMVRRNKAHIDDLLRKGWTPNEIVCCLEWVEDFNPTVSEEIALTNIKAIQDRVEARLKEERKS